MRQLLVLFTLLFFLFLLPKAQSQVFTDSFSDLNFTVNPTWIGDSANFQIDSSNQRLWLNAPAVSDESYLVTPSNAIENGVWEFRVFMDFNPSSSNKTLVYLVSDQLDLKSSLNGYFVMIGNSDDEVSLYRQDGTSQSKIIDGVDDLVDVSAPDLLVRVSRDSNGVWELLADTSLNTNYQPQGTITDTTHLTAAYFGVFCDYTSTRSDKFFFDDFSVSGTPISDKTAPQLDSILVISQNQLKLFFNEPLTAFTAQSISNYQVNNGVGNPSTASLINNKEVELSFSTNFINGSSYSLAISGIEDTSGNVMPSLNKPFVYFVPAAAQHQDVLINEFMADPTPPASLPNLEYIELWNYSNKTFDLKNWQIGDNSNFATLTDFILPPFEFVILCSTSDTSFFSGYGNVLGVSSLPALNNGGDQIRLKTNTGFLVDSLEYEDDWYKDDAKADGGFSLELISPKDDCKTTEENFMAAANAAGGTPGTINSVFDTIPDNTAPEVSSFSVLGLDTLAISFTKKMDSASLVNASYTVNGLSVTIQQISNDLTSLQLLLSPSLVLGEAYQLSISGTQDCYGNAQSTISLPFGKGRMPEAFELVITELYPDPDATVSPNLPEYEYVELLNTTNDILSLSNCIISDAGNAQLFPDYNLAPNSHLIVVERGNGFDFLPFGEVFEINELPSLNNTGDEITLKNANGYTLHFVPYDSDWYQDETKADGGFSLEMIDASNPCGGIENWRASNDTKGGTPGQQNSIAANNPDLTNPRVLSVVAINATALLVRFSETIDSNTIANSTIDISPFIGVDSIIMVSPYQLRITLSENLIGQTAYSFLVSGITDCVGNKVEETEVIFGLPEPYENGDLVINEVLSNPRPSSGTDYVELINNSEKFISLQHWAFADYDVTDDTLGTVRVISSQPFAIGPNEILLFSENTQEIIEEYPNTVEDHCVELESLPAYSNDEDRVILLDDTNGFVDDFTYNEDLHLAILADLNGVALERVDPTRPTDDETNWSSAASNENYGTPGYQNSVFQSEIAAQNPITINPEIFSPDNDGFNDVLNIQYQFDSPDFIGSVSIFNANGERETLLVNNKSFGVSGTVTWDGINDNNLKANIGIYVVVVEVYDLEGNTKVYKKSCVLGGRL